MSIEPSNPEELFAALVAQAPRLRLLPSGMTRRAAFQVGTSGEIGLAELEHVLVYADESESRLTVTSNFAVLPGYVPQKRGSIRCKINTIEDVYAAIGRASQ